MKRAYLVTVADAPSLGQVIFARTPKEAAIRRAERINPCTAETFKVYRLEDRKPVDREKLSCKKYWILFSQAVSKVEEVS